MSTLSPDIQVMTSPSQTRLVLPRRVRTAPPWVGLIPIAFGLVFAAYAVGIIYSSLTPEPPPPPLFDPGPEAPEAPAPPPNAPAPRIGWTNIIGALIGLPFLAAGLVPIFAGIALFFHAHAEIRIGPTHLVSIERAGPFRRSKKRPLQELTGLRVCLVQTSRSASATPRGPNHGIFVEVARGPGFFIAPRYSEELVTKVAHYLAAEVQRLRQGTAALQTSAAPLPPLNLTIDPPPPAPAPPEFSPGHSPAEPATPASPPPEQPANSPITCLPAADSLTFIIPRTGFRGTPAFFLFFATFWLGITSCVSAGFVVAMIQERSLEDLFACAFFALFYGIGIAMALVSVQLALRKSVLLATRQTLVFTQTGPVRSSEASFLPADIASIRMGNSNTTVNNRPLKQLQIATRTDGATRGILTGRDEPELEWIAATLRHFYGIP